MNTKNKPEEDNSEVIRPKDQKEISTIGKAISTLPKESLKSLLYLAAGRQDSNYRLFGKPIFIDISDILELNERIQEKLSHYETIGIVSVDIMYEKNKAEQFGTWAEFETHNWKTSNEINSLMVRWDFMYKLPDYVIPQRHTLTVKLQSKMILSSLWKIVKGDMTSSKKL